MTDVNVEYRKLVNAAASPQNLNRALQLAKEVVRQRSADGLRDWDVGRVASFWKEDPDPFRMEPGIVARSFVRGSEAQMDSSDDVSHRAAQDVVTTLVLGSRYAQENLKGDDYSLLIDALLLVFHQSYFSLLPALAYKIRDRSALLKGYIHLSSVLDSHAEVFRINGLVLLAAGRPAEAREYFRGALLATHSDEHVFMTRLQTLWSAMIDSGAYREALKMLMDIAPTITRQDLEEFGELVQETLDAALKTPQQT